MDHQDTTTEIWKPVPGWESRYEVSDQGRVRSIQFHGVPRKVPKILKSCDRAGYHAVGLIKPGDKRLHQVHKLVLETFVYVLG